jgi:CysZ protein
MSSAILANQTPPSPKQGKPADSRPADGHSRSRLARLLEGVRAVLGGLAFIVFRPRNWGYASVPIVIAFLLGSLAFVGVYWGSETFLASQFGEAPSGFKFVLAWLLRVLFTILGLLVALLLGLTLAQPLSGFALDALCQRKEHELGGITPPNLARGFLATLGVTALGLSFAITVVGGLSLITFFFPPLSVVTVPLKIAASALAIAWDLFDYPLSLRGMTIGRRLRFFWRHFAEIFGFALTSSVTLIMPGLGLLFLPAGVTGATHLAWQLEPRKP